MASCKDCIHYEVCGSLGMEVYRWGRKPTLQIFLDKYKAEHCTRFKTRSRFVELPCKVGTELFRIKQINGKRFITNTALNSNTFWNIVMQGEFGKTIFLSREEAEHVLKERGK